MSKTCVISLMASYVIKINSRIKCFFFLTTKCNVEGINKQQTEVKATQLQHNYFVLMLGGNQSTLFWRDMAYIQCQCSWFTQKVATDRNAGNE